MIRLYTKERHIDKIKKFLDSLEIQNEIFTVNDNPKIEKFDLGVSYCYPKKISNELLNIPKKGFVNYHPGLLPKYKGPNEYEDAIKNKEIYWGVSLHYMNEEFDSGKIIKNKLIELHEPPSSIEELGAISHFFLFELFKETIFQVYNK
jgi:methionyl-tRNA formyltransferase